MTDMVTVFDKDIITLFCNECRAAGTSAPDCAACGFFEDGELVDPVGYKAHIRKIRRKTEGRICILCSYGESVFVENPETGNQWVDCFRKCERKDGGDTCDAWEPRGQHWVD